VLLHESDRLLLKAQKKLVRLLKMRQVQVNTTSNVLELPGDTCPEGLVILFQGHKTHNHELIIPQLETIQYKELLHRDDKRLLKVSTCRL
jgi:hypothetical protein